MKNSVRTLFLSAIFATCSLSAGATTIDFNNLAHDEQWRVHEAINADGYVITNSYSDPQKSLGVWGRGDYRQADQGFAAVFVNYGFTTTTLRRADNALFSMTSIDLADVFNNGTSSKIEFTFFSAAGTATEQFVLDHQAGLQTFAMNHSDLSRVTWVTLEGDQGNSQFDNIVVTASAIPDNTVPEPASLGLLGVGLLGIRASRKSRAGATS